MSLRNDVKIFQDELPEIIKSKKRYLFPLEEMLTKKLHDLEYIRLKMFNREVVNMTGVNREIFWMLWCLVLYSFDGLKNKLASVRSELDNINASEKILAALNDDREIIDIGELKEIPITDFYTEKTKENSGKLVGKCPFHIQQSGSFTIYLHNNTFYCFSCGAGGDVINFYEKINNLTPKQAIKELSSYIKR